MPVSVQVVVVGSYNHDHLWRCARFPEQGETLQAIAYAGGSGGKGSNQAIACARQGAATALIAALGDDAAAGVARTRLAAEGVQAQWQHCPDAATGNACVLVDAQGHNRILVHAGANALLDAGHVRAQRALLAAAAVVLAQCETPTDATGAAFALVDRAALRLLNPAPVPPALPRDLLTACDVLLPNETEFAALLRQCGDRRVDADALAALSDAELAALAACLPVPTLLLTLGAAGVFVAHRDAPALGDDVAHYRIPALPVSVRDSTGAGDVLCGVLAAQLAQTPRPSLRNALRHAVCAASISTEHSGAADAAPSREAVLQRLAAMPA